MKNIPLSFALMLLFIYPSEAVVAQNTHFSQFYNAPLALNPALTGLSEGQIRLFANHRSQWASFLNKDAFQTSAVSGDIHIPVHSSDFFGLGFNLLSDAAGEVSFQTSEAKIAASFGKTLHKSKYVRHTLVAGISAGTYQTRIDFSNAQWGSQFDVLSQDFNRDIDSFEAFENDSSINPDLSAGLFYYMTSQKKGTAYVGAALDNLIEPSNWLSSFPIRTGIKTTFHAGGIVPLSQFHHQFTLHPKIVFFHQNGLFEINGGLSWRTLLDKDSNNALSVGTWLRLANKFGGSLLTDAIILSTKLELDKLSFGFSYDLNISPLQQVSYSNGGIEVSVAYFISSKIEANVSCPKF